MVGDEYDVRSFTDHSMHVTSIDHLQPYCDTKKRTKAVKDANLYILNYEKAYNQKINFSKFTMAELDQHLKKKPEFLGNLFGTKKPGKPKTLVKTKKPSNPNQQSIFKIPLPTKSTKRVTFTDINAGEEMESNPSLTNPASALPPSMTKKLDDDQTPLTNVQKVVKAVQKATAQQGDGKKSKAGLIDSLEALMAAKSNRGAGEKSATKIDEHSTDKPEPQNKMGVFELFTIEGEIGPDGKIDHTDMRLERSIGFLNYSDGSIHSKYGIIDPKKEISAIRNESKIYFCDPKNGQMLIANSEPNCKIRHIINLGAEIESPILEVIICSGKYNEQNRKIDPCGANIQIKRYDYNPNKRDFATPLGACNIKLATFISTHKNRFNVKQAELDPNTGHFILRNEMNPDTKELDQDYARIVSLRIVHREIDPKTQVICGPAPQSSDVVINSDSHQMWLPDIKDPITNETVFVSTQADPSGYIITNYGYRDPETKQITKIHTGIITNITKMDNLCLVYGATGKCDDDGNPLYANSQLSENTIKTKFAKYKKDSIALIAYSPNESPTIGEIGSHDEKSEAANISYMLDSLTEAFDLGKRAAKSATTIVEYNVDEHQQKNNQTKSQNSGSNASSGASNQNNNPPSTPPNEATTPTESE